MQRESLPGFLGLYACHETDYVIAGDNPILMALCIAAAPREASILVWVPGYPDNWHYQVASNPVFARIAAQIAGLPEREWGRCWWDSLLSSLFTAREIGFVKVVTPRNGLMACRDVPPDARGYVWMDLGRPYGTDWLTGLEFDRCRVGLQADADAGLRRAMSSLPLLGFQSGFIGGLINRIPHLRMDFLDTGIVVTKHLILTSIIPEIDRRPNCRNVLRVGRARAAGVGDGYLVSALDDLGRIHNYFEGKP